MGVSAAKGKGGERIFRQPLRWALFCLKNGVQTFDEFLNVLELSVDAGESNISNLVDGAKLFHNRFAEESGIDFRVEPAFDKRLDSGDHLVYLFGGNRTFPTGFFDAGAQLGAIVRYANAISLDDFQSVFLNAFVSCKPTIARQAQPTPTNRRSVLSGAGINYFIVVFAAKRTSQNN